MRYGSDCSSVGTSCASGRAKPLPICAMSADFAEQVTQREHDDVLGAISSSAQAELQQVEAALRRLASGRYTTCAVCGEDIEPERLAAVPYTDRCRTCAEGGRRAAGRDGRG